MILMVSSARMVLADPVRSPDSVALSRFVALLNKSLRFNVVTSPPTHGSNVVVASVDIVRGRLAPKPTMFVSAEMVSDQCHSPAMTNRWERYFTGQLTDRYKYGWLCTAGKLKETGRRLLICTHARGLSIWPTEGISL